MGSLTIPKKVEASRQPLPSDSLSSSPNDKMADYTDGQVHSFAQRYAGRADQSGPPRPAMEALVDVARAGEPGAAF